MTQDATHQTFGLYQKQNGSPGLSSGSTLEIHSGATVKVEDGGVFAHPVTTVATTAGTVTNCGYTILGATQTAAWTLNAPSAAGIEKTLACTVSGASSVSQTLTFTGATCLNPAGGSTAAITTLTWTEPGVVVLVSATTAVWHVKSIQGSVVGS